MNIEKLLQAAQHVKERAYAPYSNFHVGAALSTPSGKIYSGCNVENSSYGLTICAERNAIFQMIAAGENKISELLIIGDSEHFLPPCGACRQVIAEFANKNTPIYMCNKNGAYQQTTVGELIPYMFFLDK
ncbi:MAG: cytidine deaminase [Acidobacteria bacterium]|jgi:cytidine deaminase|nr:cytidine deaminase [Acidobacteriota bacterium]